MSPGSLIILNFWFNNTCAFAGRKYLAGVPCHVLIKGEGDQRKASFYGHRE